MVGVFPSPTAVPLNFFRKPPRGSERRPGFNKYLLWAMDGAVEGGRPSAVRPDRGGRTEKNWGRQPPSFLLEEECHRNMAFTLYHADQMPEVELQSATARKLNVSGPARFSTPVLIRRLHAATRRTASSM
jgi:hypothetical protein